MGLELEFISNSLRTWIPTSSLQRLSNPLLQHWVHPTFFGHLNSQQMLHTSPVCGFSNASPMSGNTVESCKERVILINSVKYEPEHRTGCWGSALCCRSGLTSPPWDIYQCEFVMWIVWHSHHRSSLQVGGDCLVKNRIRVSMMFFFCVDMTHVLTAYEGSFNPKCQVPGENVL